STAVRLVDGDTHRAQDVVQVVFADLAQMAGKLSGGAMLGGWLHRHTCFVARTVMRGERRRRARERLAVEMNALNDQTDSVLAQIAPILDEAIQELGPDDRDAILLRFFERRSLRSVGEALGTNENVAQKRVARAVQELGILLQRRGVALSAAALASSLAAGAVTAAPAGLAASIAGAVLAGAGAAGGSSLTSGKVALMAKLKVGITTAIVVGGVVATIFLLNQPKPKLRAESPPVLQQPEQSNSTGDLDSETTSPVIASPSPTVQPREVRIEAPQIEKQRTEVVLPPARPIAAAPRQTVTDNLLPASGWFTARTGSKMRIEGTANIIHPTWTVESTVIGGFLELAPGIANESGQPLEPGPVRAQAEAFISVRSLKSVEQDGRAYSDRMDEIMYDCLREQQYHQIRYRLLELSLRGVTNHNGVLQCGFDSRGELVIAGITNEISMPVFMLPLVGGRLQISGITTLKMTSFQIDPPNLNLVIGAIKVGDEVRLQFDWVVAPKGSTSTPTQSGLVPLILELPAPAFKGTPKNVPFGPNVEPLSDKPRAPMMVPAGLENIAPGSVLSSSDKNIPADALARITDGDKAAADRSIIFLRKGTQWVQMDLGSPQELFALVIWHAHNTAKVYHDVIVQVADDPDFMDNVRTLFNNDTDNTSSLGVGTNREYFETYEGKLINAKGCKARWIRFYSKGSTESALNEYTEIEVYGRRAQ
ncbi:MAG: YceI family protein, partial [Verrucomicrobia bacterium]|nr:YceI family protein [Verrucomicrobiota bacterium]